jgi:hypothetical protein
LDLSRRILRNSQVLVRNSFRPAQCSTNDFVFLTRPNQQSLFPWDRFENSIDRKDQGIRERSVSPGAVDASSKTGDEMRSCV